MAAFLPRYITNAIANANNAFQKIDKNLNTALTELKKLKETKEKAETEYNDIK